MAKGLTALNAHIAKVEGLPQAARRAAPAVAEALEAELRRTIAAGTTPDGVAWQRREDGGKPLGTAAKSLAVVAIGSRVFARLRGHVARHHRGIAKGGIERPILPMRLTPRLGELVRREVLEQLQAHMGGRRA